MKRINSVLTLQATLFEYFTKKKQKNLYVIAVTIYIFIVLGQQMPFLSFLSDPLMHDRLLPILTMLLILLYILVLPNPGMIRARKNKDSFVGWAFFLSGLLISLKLVLGILMSCVGKSPYDHSLNGIVGNMFVVLPFYVMQEILRYYSFCIGKKENRKICFLLILVLFVVLQIDYSQIIKLSESRSIVMYAFQTFIPLIIEQAICNLLVILGGYTASLCFVLIPLLFEYLFPILPVLDWFTEGILRILLDSISLFILIGHTDRMEYVSQKREKESIVSTGIVLGFCVLLIWFTVGVFPVYPSIVLTGSMEPKIMRGDIVLIDKFNTQDDIMKIKVGDVVNFDRDDINITHRVIEILEQKDGSVKYRTKGDNNPCEDTRLVEMSEMNGAIIGTIPKLGMPVLWMKSNDVDTIGKEINGQ